MEPQFLNQLNLQNNSRTVAAGGPCGGVRGAVEK
jgi:hypothetical protein